MKCKFLFLAFAMIISLFMGISMISAVETNITHSSTSIAQIKSLKYEPYPVNPGEYFDMWISVTFLRNPRLETEFELISSYPFSLDSNESAKKTYPASSVSSSILLKYKVRVDKNAVEGTNQITLLYKFEGVYYTQTFDIEVENAQTNFDAVVQDATSSQVSIAIANTGKNTANSVIVKIPEQSNFQVTGTDGQMVGNLESGDYSIVSFEISRKISQQNPSKMEEETEKDSEADFKMPSSNSADLTFDIYYTDNIGVRRVISMTLPLAISPSANMSEMFGQMRGGKNTSFPWYVIVIAFAVLGIISFVIYKKIPKSRKFFRKLNPKNWLKNKEEKSEIPDWIKKEKERGKIK